MTEYNSNKKWSNTDSAFFLEYGQALIPDRDKLEQIFIDLLPRNTQEAFTVVDICVGGGWLTEAILRRYPRSTVMALDGSESMLEATRKRLASYQDRVTYKTFDLHHSNWIDQLETVDYFVSSLALHHLEDREKEALFRRLYSVLKPEGRVIIADLIKPDSESSRLIAAREWDEIVKEQSEQLYGNLEAYDFFQREQWNLFYYPDDPIDKPSMLLDQIGWLSKAGFNHVEVLYYRAGHALFSGLKE